MESPQRAFQKIQRVFVSCDQCMSPPRRCEEAFDKHKVGQAETRPPPSHRNTELKGRRGVCRVYLLSQVPLLPAVALLHLHVLDARVHVHLGHAGGQRAGVRSASFTAVWHASSLHTILSNALFIYL